MRNRWRAVMDDGLYMVITFSLFMTLFMQMAISASLPDLLDRYITSAALSPAVLGYHIWSVGGQWRRWLALFCSIAFLTIQIYAIVRVHDLYSRLCMGASILIVLLGHLLSAHNHSRDKVEDTI